MKNRIIIGVLLFVGLVLIAWWDFAPLNFVLFAFILAMAFYESLQLFDIDYKALCVIPLVFFTFLPFTNDFNDLFKIILLNISLVAGVLAYTKSTNLKFILPFIYPTIPIFIMFGLYYNFGMDYLIWLILTVVASDSGAYFVGKAIGKTPFSPSSPNKTLEGLAGGFIISIIIGSVFAMIFTDISFFIIITTTILVSLFGIFGDLFESYLKRLSGVKDTSSLLGEQGGIMDRIDGYLFGSIAMFLVLA